MRSAPNTPATGFHHGINENRWTAVCGTTEEQTRGFEQMKMQGWIATTGIFTNLWKIERRIGCNCRFLQYRFSEFFCWWILVTIETISRVSLQQVCWFHISTKVIWKKWSPDRKLFYPLNVTWSIRLLNISHLVSSQPCKRDKSELLDQKVAFMIFIFKMQRNIQLTQVSHKCIKIHSLVVSAGAEEWKLTTVDYCII